MRERLGVPPPGGIAASGAPERRSIFAQGQETKASRADAAFGAISLTPGRRQRLLHLRF